MVAHQSDQGLILRANLAEPRWVSHPIRIGPGLRRLSIDVNPTTWGTAKLEVTYALSDSIDPEDGSSVAVFRSFAPEKIELTAAAPSQVNRPVAGVRWIRIENTVHDVNADRAAKLVVLLE
jgi:hypothetical protein